MPESARPDPDVLLARLQHDEQAASGRGRLRIYLGAFPGVGKTYAMLNEAHRRTAYGEDVVVGFVETHKRRNTAAMLDGLEVVPRRQVQYHGVVVEEMDVDAILARRPRVCLVDELAHTNAPGSEREKRYEDVQVLLDAGIDVVSTLNVQHLESMNDTVEALTGVRVRETLPDFVLDEADEVILVDLSPEGARARMQHGHIYPPAQAETALERFFTIENLNALRELALRRTAQEVDAQLEDLMRQRRSVKELDVVEQVLVLTTDAPGDRALIRYGWRLAQGFNAHLQVAYVTKERTDAAAHDLARTLELAEDFNASIVPLEDEKALVTHIKAASIEHVVLAHQPSSALSRLFRPSLADQLLKASPGLKLHFAGA